MKNDFQFGGICMMIYDEELGFFLGKFKNMVSVLEVPAC